MARLMQQRCAFSRPEDGMNIGLGTAATGRIAIGALGVVALALGGCAGNGQRPDADLARAEAGIRQAEQSGAEQYGGLELQAARDKLERARAAANEGAMATARQLAEQASLDPQFAAAKARSRKAPLAGGAVQRSIAAMQQEVQRGDRRRGDWQCPAPRRWPPGPPPRWPPWPCCCSPAAPAPPRTCRPSTRRAPPWNGWRRRKRQARWPPSPCPWRARPCRARKSRWTR